MKKIRIGNDFPFLWQISRGNEIQDLNQTTDSELTYRAGTQKRKVLAYTLTDAGVIMVEVTPTVADKIGVYNLRLTYKVADETLADGQLECTVDVDAFEIVPESAKADAIPDVAITSDLLIALRGPVGPKMQFSDLTAEEKLEITGDVTALVGTEEYPEIDLI